MRYERKMLLRYLIGRVGIKLLHLLCAGLLICQHAYCQKLKPSLEYQVKASLIYNLLQFVEWPPELWNSFSEVTVCVTEPDPFGIALDAMERELIMGKPLKVARVRAAAEELSQCNLVFVNRSVDETKVLEILANDSVLTIGESSTFLDHGGMISFQVERGKVVFDINRDALRSARLNVSSKLLRIARNVIEKL